MTTTLNSEEKSRFSLWVRAVRLFSYTAVIAPVLIGAMAALAYSPNKIDWFLLPFVLFGAIFLQAGGNLMSEYYDFLNNVDRKDTLGSTRVLVDDLMRPTSILRASYIAFISGVSLGLVAVIYRGDFTLLYIGLIGLACGYLYGAKPLKLKYVALGDLAILLSFGPLMVFGSYFALTGHFNPNIFLIALPISCLVIAILHANNARDIRDDGIAKIKTLAMVFGVKGSILYYNTLVIGAFIGVLALIALKLLPIWSLIVFISLPPALKNIKRMNTAQLNKPENISNLDETTAQHHLLFGLLLSISLLVQHFAKFSF